SHTNTAADEIRRRILDDDNIQEYQDATGTDIFRLVKESRKTLDDTITTMHKCFMARIPEKKGRAVVFNIDDYNNLKIQYPLFDAYTGSKEFHSLDMLIARHPFFKFHSTARDNGFDTVKYYWTLSFEEKSKCKYTITELLRLEKDFNNFKGNIKLNQRAERILDFQDMIEHFTNSVEIKSEDLGIKILMVDEAQDSSIIQRAAEKKMAAAVEYFYKAGDPDQALFGFAGADPHEFHIEFARPEIELKQGFRCPRVINEYCKEIIRPLWKHYKYAGGGRVWAPREENDQVVEGEKFEMMSLEQDPHLAELSKRLKQTKETFAFTYRGNEPKEAIRYLTKLGVPFKIADKHSRFQFKYPTADIKNQREFLKLIREKKKLTAASIKRILKNTLPEYVGKNYSEENLEKIVGHYDIEWLIKHQFLNPIVKKSNDFQNIKKLSKISYISTIEMKNFIRRVVEYDPVGDLEKTPRIFLENIHTIKGKEFDNCIVDLAIHREEDDFTKRRIKYVACSRAKKTLWIIKSKNGQTL
ncbi:MAG: ATP-dependent helicase, partial [Pelagibacterales bacterium]|nr:ATP-dependent helicase [Pelagibacterales bacterium]